MDDGLEGLQLEENKTSVINDDVKIQAEMTPLRKMGLLLGATLSLAFITYMIELLLRTNWGRRYESIGTDVIAFSICAAVLGLFTTTIASWQTRFGVRVLGTVSVAVLPLLVWFIWALSTDIIADKSDCVRYYGFFRCTFRGAS